jgi:predicted transcriptional regulator
LQKESTILFEGGFQVRNKLNDKQSLVADVQYQPEKSAAMEKLNPMNWFASKKSIKEEDKGVNVVDIEVYKKVDRFPKFVIRSGK